MELETQSRHQLKFKLILQYICLRTLRLLKESWEKKWTFFVTSGEMKRFKSHGRRTTKRSKLPPQNTFKKILSARIHCLHDSLFVRPKLLTLGSLLVSHGIPLGGEYPFSFFSFSLFVYHALLNKERHDRDIHLNTRFYYQFCALFSIVCLPLFASRVDSMILLDMINDCLPILIILSIQASFLDHLILPLLL